MTQQVTGDLTGLKQVIFKEAQKKCEDLLAQAKVKAQEITQAAQKRAEQAAAGILAQAASEAQEQKRQLEIQAKLEQNKQTLAAKRELLAQAFSLALSSFAQLSQAEYQEFIFELLVASRDEACGTLVISPAETRINGEFLSRVARELNWRLEIVQEDVPGLEGGGFLLRGEKLEIDCRLSTILELNRPQLEAEVARILFGQL